jgi:uncharacterized protein YkwD
MSRLRTLAAVAALLIMAGPAAVTASARRQAVVHATAHRRACANANTAATAHNLATMRAAVLCLVNRQRTSRGLPPLRENARLDRSAQGWTQRMVTFDEFTHGADFAARITAVGYDWSYAGENIATGYPTPRSVMNGWMASQGHCQNILDPGFSAIGIGVVPRAVRGWASGPATWTEDFGLPMGYPNPSNNHRPADGCPY